MSVVYGLKLACDLYYYFAAIALFGALVHASGALIALPVLLGIGAGAGFAAAGKGQWARYLPLSLCLVAMPWLQGPADVLRALPALAYAVLYVRGNRRATDYDYACERFRQGMFLMPLCLFFCLTLGAESFLSAVPPLFLHLTLSVTLLRMLRHEDRTIAQKRFQAMNLMGVAGACGLGALLSTDWALWAFKAVALFLYDFALLPVLRAVLWLVNGVLRGISWLLSLLPWGDGAMDAPQLDAEFAQETELQMELGVTAEQVAANPVVKYVLAALGIVALCALTFALLRILSRQMSRDAAVERREERESIDASRRGESAGGALRRRKDPVDAVRYTYRKFLRLAQSRSVPINERQNSLQIRNLSRTRFEESALDALRETYIRARYGEISGPEDVQRAKDAYERLRATSRRG